jgi:hypothetical protein
LAAVAASAPRGLSVDWHVKTERRRALLLVLLALMFSVTYGWLVLRLDFASVVPMVAAGILILVLWQPRTALNLAFFLIALFEVGGADPLMVPGEYLHFGLQKTLRLSGMILSPLEMLLLVALLVVLIQHLGDRRQAYRGGTLGWPMALFALMVGVGLAHGLLSGGDPYTAFWEVRTLPLIAASYILAANTIGTTRHLTDLTGLFLLGTGLFAVEGAYRKIFLIDTSLLGVAPEFAYGHDTVVFLGTFLLLVLAQQIYGAPTWQRIFGLLFSPIVIYTLLATERRAAYIAAAIAFVAYTLVFLVSNRRAFLLVALPALIGGAIYLPLFWNVSGPLGQPARAVRSLTEPDGRDASSNEYRRLEGINVAETIRANPLLGVGFGREFTFVVPMADLSWWPFWRFEPHHNLHWVWLKTGVVGFIAFWVLVGSGLMRAAHLARGPDDSTVIVFALLVLAGMIGMLVFSYVDLGLISPRLTIFFGTLLGAVSVLDRVRRDVAPLGSR